MSQDAPTQSAAENSPAVAPEREGADGEVKAGQIKISADPLRVDKWLWAARIFKTRSIAAEACEGGHVRVNGLAIKPAKPVRPGDQIEVRREGWSQVLEVAATAELRGPAAVAVKLYVDHSPPRPVRPPPVALREAGAGRPTKRDRRELDRLKGE